MIIKTEKEIQALAKALAIVVETGEEIAKATGTDPDSVEIGSARASLRALLWVLGKGNPNHDKVLDEMASML